MEVKVDNMRISGFQAQQVEPAVRDQNGNITTPGFFYFRKGNGSELKVTQDDLAALIQEGKDDGVDGVEFAISQFLSTMNQSFRDLWSEDGYTIVEIADDGEPLRFESGRV